MILFSSHLSELITEKVENDKEISVPLTAAEKVGRNMDLMNLIIRNIDNVEDRKGIAESCKALNILCGSKKSHVEFYKYDMREKRILNFPRDEPLLIIFGEILVISISRYCRSMTKKLEMIRSKILMNKYKIKALKIRNLPAGYFDFFKELDCFESVNTVYFDVLKSDHIPLRIFNEWKNLKPDTLIFGNVYRSNFDYRDSERALHWNENYTFPESIKHVHLICGGENVDWMANALRNFNHYELESLTLVSGKNSAEILTADYMKSIVSIARYFKEVIFSLCYDGFLPSNEYFRQTLSCFAGVESCDIIIDFNFNVAKCDVDVWVGNDPSNREENDALNFNLYENVSLDDRYLHIKSVEIHDNIWGGDFLDEDEIMNIQDGLSKMKNLLTLEVNFFIMPRNFNSSSLFCALNGNLKNIRLRFLDECFDENDLKTLAKYSPNIENIFLEEVEEHGITIKMVTSLFKNLKGLRINFDFRYPTKNVVIDLIKEDVINGNHLLDWPKLNFLCVHFRQPDVIERELLDAVDRNTPRKPGQFLVNRDIMDDGVSMWQIIIQKSTNCAYIFNNIFDNLYIF
uniref:F-box domain-containing protein n=1 Tax=Strongyloides papillosus TaxID=174720 RepID=A0A0N5C2Y9_STREA